MYRHQGFGDGLEGARMAGAGVHDCLNRLSRRVGQEAAKEHVDASKVLHKHEIAALFPISVPARALEHADRSGVDELSGEVVNDRGHAALVLFARTVDVEVAETDYCRVEARCETPYVVIEDQLGKAIDVQGPLVCRIDCKAG